MNYIKEYIKQIDKGKVAVSKRVDKIYRRLLEDIDNPKEWYFDEERATKPIDFIEKFCKQSKGEWIGKSVELQLFQKAFIQALFGFINKEGVRRFKETFFLVARKNGRDLPPNIVIC